MGSEGGGESLSILVADGEASFADAVADAFKATANSVQIQATTSTSDALDRVKADSIDAVLVGDGLDSPTDAIERLTNGTDRPVIFLSDTAADSPIATAVEEGVDDIFPRVPAESQYELLLERIATDYPEIDTGNTASQTAETDSEPAYRTVFENVSDGLVVHHAETGEILDVNERFCEMNGYDREALIGNDIGVVTAPGEEYNYEAAQEKIEAAREEGSQLFEWRNQHRNGDTFPVEIHLSVVDLHGTERVLASVRDISERKRREREYEQIFNGVNDSIVIQDPDTTEPLDANDTFLERLGYENVEDIRHRGFEGLSVTEAGYTKERAQELYQRVIETGEPETIEWQQETRDGETRWIEATVDSAVIQGDERILSMQRDITERKRRERIIRSLHESTDELHDAATPREICEATVTAAEEVLDLSMPTCWLHGVETPDRLTPVAATEAAWNPPQGSGLEEFGPGSFQYDVFEDNEMRVYDPRDLSNETPLQRAMLIPLGEHGLFGAAEPGVEAFDEIILDAAQILARHARTALDRVKHEQELRESERRFRTIAERVDEIIYLANADLTEVHYVNPAYADIFGRPVEELYEDARAFLESVHPDDRSSYEADIEAMLADIRSGDPNDRYAFEFRIQRPDGETRWLDSTGYPIRSETDEPHRFVGITEDVTDQYRREQTLETFHEATRKLTEADSREAACRHAVSAAEDVLGFPLVSTFLYDDTTGRLEPTAVTTRLTELDVDLPSFDPGESLPWQVYVEGDAVTSSDQLRGIYGQGVSDPDVVLPLGAHGIMLVGAPTDDFDDEDIELTQILAATLEAALNHVADEQTLEAREAELRRQQERATRLERLNTIIRDIEQATVDQSSRTGIEEAVCERLIEVDTHDLVWIAEPVVGEDELVPRTSVGEKEAYLDALTVELDTTGSGHPAVPAYQQKSPQVIENVATDISTGQWRTRALRHGVQSVIAVPIQYESTIHGVLTVASTDPDAFDDGTQTVLAELGRSIGYAISVTQREQALESEGTTELEFSIADDGLLLVRGSAAADCRIRLERTIRRTGGSFSMFYVIEQAEPGELVELANAAPSVETAQIVSADDDAQGGLIEVTAPTWFGSIFTEHGAVVREASAETGEGTLVIEAPRGADVRTLVEGFTERYPETKLQAQRQRDRTIRSLFELQDALKADLTDRQWEALETAYSAGYFGWPRETSGEEVADLIGVTQPTFNKHLRIAEQSAFRMLLDREYPDSVD